MEGRSLLAEATISICFSDPILNERSLMHQSSYMVCCFRRYGGLTDIMQQGVGEIPLRTTLMY